MLFPLLFIVYLYLQSIRRFQFEWLFCVAVVLGTSIHLAEGQVKDISNNGFQFYDLEVLSWRNIALTYNQIRNEVKSLIDGTRCMKNRSI